MPQVDDINGKLSKDELFIVLSARGAEVLHGESGSFEEALMSSRGSSLEIRRSPLLRPQTEPLTFLDVSGAPTTELRASCTWGGDCRSSDRRFTRQIQEVTLRRFLTASDGQSASSEKAEPRGKHH